MQWLDNLVKEINERFPEGDLLIQSGASPSGKYHFGHLREVITCDAIVLALTKVGRTAKHVHFIDDLDALRKIPVNIPTEYEKYLGMSLCDIPAPDGSDKSYADFFLDDFANSMKILGINAEFIHSHEKYRAGFFVGAIEITLDNLKQAKGYLEDISQRKLDENWSPIQVSEDGRLKNRQLVSMDKDTKTITYKDTLGNNQEVKYDKGLVKLDWRLDWPARWSLLKVHAEPFGRDHATKGGSYDTGVAIVKNIFNSEPPVPVPYDFVNRAGDTKKMSASKGTGIDASEAVQVLPPEVARFFMLRFPPDKRLYFDSNEGVTKLVDEYAELLAKESRNNSEEQLVYVSTSGLDHKTVSRVPFSHLVASYQAALKDADKTIEVLKRTEYSQIAEEDSEIIKAELRFIDEWLNRWAPDDVKFSLTDNVDPTIFSDNEKAYFKKLAQIVSAAPIDADGSWFHKSIYELKDEFGLDTKEMFQILYKLIIGRDSGPRAGWFLSTLPRDWLIARLNLEK
jgi:lysyl-tRNA synthetase class 1